MEEFDLYVIQYKGVGGLCGVADSGWKNRNAGVGTSGSVRHFDLEKGRLVVWDTLLRAFIFFLLQC